MISAWKVSWLMQHNYNKKNRIDISDNKYNKNSKKRWPLIHLGVLPIILSNVSL